MAVGFKVDSSWYEIGNGDFLHMFFSNVCYHLENKKWGSKFKIIMNDLYNGQLSYTKVKEALIEINNIYESFSKVAPKDVIWDIENLEKRPPWGDVISADIKNLGNYFVTSSGENFFDIIKEALEEAYETQFDVYIISI